MVRLSWGDYRSERIGAIAGNADLWGQSVASRLRLLQEWTTALVQVTKAMKNGIIAPDL
jgi:hypothetical protein